MFPGDQLLQHKENTVNINFNAATTPGVNLIISLNTRFENHGSENT